MRYTKYIAILLTFFAVACTTEEFDQPLKNVGNRVKIATRVMPFTDCNVSSRTAKNDKENEVKSLDLIIFGNDLNCVYMTHSSGESVFSIDRGTQKENETVLDNGDFAGISQDNLSECQIYAIANFPELSTSDLGVGDHVTEFMNISTAVSGINIPSTGMPMLGSYVGKVDLRASDEQITEPYEVPMQALYSKIVFNIEVDATQTTANQTPQFMIQGFKVQNVAESVDFYPGTESAKDLNDGNNDETAIIMNGDEPKVFDGVITGSTIATDGGNSISFSFYLPERFLQAATAASQYAYPFGTGANIREEDKNLRQRYKPLIAKDEATFVTFTGVYTDHQGHTFDVSYDIYVGNDNYGNFDVVRNHQYNNMITIKGIQNSSDQSTVEGAVSIDHRVTVERTQPVIISLRRETLLDAHFEVRPLRIRANMDHEGGTSIQNAKVEILNIDGTATNRPNWIRLERSFGAGTVTGSPDIYCTAEGSSKGKRKFFTYGLVTGKQLDGTDEPNNISDNTSIEVPINTDGECVWIYIDECTEASTNINAIRSAMIRISYGNEKIDYVINQHKLFAVTTTRSEWTNGASFDHTYTYYIEHEEEYLHNFDADDTFEDNPTEYEGMRWGLDGIQLSHTYDAIHLPIESSILNFLLQFLGFDSTEEMCNNKLKEKGLNPKYDFYLSRDTENQKLEIRDFLGHTFNQEIASYLKSEHANNTSAKIEGITLDENPQSAFAYCYNRNKRNENGDIVSQDWYMPAIDEIEDIMETAHSSFDDFHGKLYWSCQPAYNLYDLNLKYFKYQLFTGYVEQDPIKGYFYTDNTQRARATKAEYVNGDFEDVISSATESSGTQSGELRSSSLNASFTLGERTENDVIYDDYPGNLSRSQKARVRCVRNTATLDTSN